LIFKELDACKPLSAAFALLSAQKEDYGPLSNPCQAVDFLAFSSLLNICSRFRRYSHQTQKLTFDQRSL